MAQVSLLRKVIVLTIFFTSGAFGAVTTNIMYNTKSVGLHNREILFRKPWFQGWVMFFGMSCILVNTPFITRCKCPPYRVGGTVRGWGLFRLVAIPAICDMGATLLQNIAFLYLIPSIWQMLRGSILLFTALFAIFYRKKRLRAPDWLGVVTTIVGISIVGVSAILKQKDEDEDGLSVTVQIVAMVLVIMAQGLQAFQTIVEEELLHDIDATESEIVAFEGIWGLFFSTFIMMPLANIVPQNWGEGLFEQSVETFVMIFGSWKIMLLVAVYTLAIVGYNQTGMMVTMFSTAIHRNIYEALRSIAVWALSVIIYYMFPDSGCGEKLELMSLVQLLGFVVSILGSFIYNRVIKLPFFDYEEYPEMQRPLGDSVMSQ